MKYIYLWLAAVMLWLGSGICIGQADTGSLDYQYALIEAIKQKNLGNIPDAVKLYRLVIQEKPDCDAAHFELGTIYLMSDRIDLAVQSLEKAYNLDRENQWYTIAYLNALGEGEQYESMEKILKEKIRSEPEEVEWEYQLAALYFSQGKTKKAIKTLEDIENAHGFSEKVTLLKASIYESEEKYELARQEIEKVMVLFPEAIQFRIVAAELCMKSGLEDQAADYYLEILEVDSTNIFALTNLTDYYRKKEDYESSFRYLAKSFKNNLIDARRKMAILSYYLSEEKFINNFKEELDHLLKVLIGMHPEEMEIYLMAADFYIQTREYDKAYWQMKNYLENNNKNFPVYMQAIMLANAGSLNEELISITEEALKSYPDSVDIRFFRGIGFYEQGNYLALISNFDSISLDELSNEDYIFQSKMLYAEACYRLNDYIRSDSIFEMLIEEEPDNYTVLNNYSYYLAERGEKLGKAEAWSHKAISNNPENATFLDTYAWVLFKLERLEEAEEFILKALDKGGENDPEINEHAGDIQVGLESPEIAKSYYKKAIIMGGDKVKLEKKIDLLESGENE